MTRQPIASTRVLVVISMVVIAVLLLATSVQARGSGDATEVTQAAATYVVVAGDSLWDIAAEVTPAGGDVRAMVFEIRSINGLADSTIRIGEVLSLPAR